MTSDIAAFNQQLADAARSMQAEDGTQQTLQRAVDSVTEIVASCDLAGISILRKGGIEPRPPATSSPDASTSCSTS
jgi:predicted heme/steroid binding protein